MGYIFKNNWIYLAKLWDIVGKIKGYIWQEVWDILG